METDVSTKNEVFHLLLHIFNIKIDYKDLYLSTQMSMAILFVSAWVLFDGAFTLCVYLTCPKVVIEILIKRLQTSLRCLFC